ncbi:MAG: GreA/GreB family elongation factor [Crocinitomicaceae bacterium]|nr:GreA/GreB family elongation factor [Crocinitomicaceae bacterium]
MKNGKLIVEKNEFKIISELVKNIDVSENLMNQCIHKLKQELSTAIVIEDEDFPSDVIRLNSIVDVETPFGIMKAQLVLPNMSNTAEKKISLLTPMGSAILGYAEGDEIMWSFPNGEKLIKILKVINPN